MILGRTKQRVPIPHEPDEWVEIRDTIPPRVVAEARDIAAFQVVRKSARAMTESGGGEQFVELQKVIAAAAPKGAARKAQQAAAEEAADLDIDVVVAYAVTGWSYRDEKGRSIDPSPEAIADLDSTTLDWLRGLARERITPPDTAGN